MKNLDDALNLIYRLQALMRLLQMIDDEQSQKTELEFLETIGFVGEIGDEMTSRIAGILTTPERGNDE